MGPRDIQHHTFQKCTGPDDLGARSSHGILDKRPPSIPVHCRGPQPATYRHRDNGGLRKKFRLQVREYAQLHKAHDNTMQAHVTGAIALRPTGNTQM